MPIVRRIPSPQHWSGYLLGWLSWGVARETVAGRRYTRITVPFFDLIFAQDRM